MAGALTGGVAALDAADRGGAPAAAVALDGPLVGRARWWGMLQVGHVRDAGVASPPTRQAATEVMLLLGPTAVARLGRGVAAFGGVGAYGALVRYGAPRSRSTLPSRASWGGSDGGAFVRTALQFGDDSRLALLVDGQLRLSLDVDGRRALPALGVGVRRRLR